jgi:hypothetical protein
MYTINFFNLAEIERKQYKHPSCNLCNTFYEEKRLYFEFKLTNLLIFLCFYVILWLS